MDESPRPIRRTAPPGETHDSRDRFEVPSVVDFDVDVFGSEAAAARLVERLEHIRSGAARLAEDGQPLLSPPLTPSRDRLDGPASARATLVVFGAHGTPASRPLGKVLVSVRTSHPVTVAVAWRHYPDPVVHPRAAVLALAAEAAAARGRFWTLTRELLHMRHHDPADLHAAIVRAGLDPESTQAAMHAGTGADRIADDVSSALASGVTFAPALFVNGERYRGELDPAVVLATLDDALRRS
jgi:hypothetical protein